MMWLVAIWTLIGLTTLSAMSGDKKEVFCDNVELCERSGVEVFTLVKNGSGPPQVRCFDSASNASCLLPHREACNHASSIFRQVYSPCDARCPGYYSCSRTGNCVERSTVCDGNSCNGCPEDDDDWKTGIGFQCVRNGRFCRLPQQLLWDNVFDCDDEADLCYSSSSAYDQDPRDLRSVTDSTFNSAKCFQCLDGSMIVPRRKVCDGLFDCADLSDECLCTRKRPELCSKVQWQTADSPKICSEGEVLCEANKTCMNRSVICDGVLDCSDGSDERFTYCGGTLPCRHGKNENAGEVCRCEKECSSPSGKFCDGFGDCPSSGPAGSEWEVEPGFPEDECAGNCDRPANVTCTVPHWRLPTPEQFTIECEKQVVSSSILAEIHILTNADGYCDGKIDCANMADESAQYNCTRFNCPSKGLVSIEEHQVCDGVVNCDDASDENRTLCKVDRFFCSSRHGSKISVPKDVVCDFNINCDKAEDEMNCTNDGRFYCEDGNPMFVAKNKLFDGVHDCKDWSDECPSTVITKGLNVLSSRKELIGNWMLRSAVWIMALLAIFGNSVVIFGECKKLTKMFKRRGNASKRANHMIVLNLAISDLLMGVYLLMLGIVGAVYSNVYCSKSLEWLNSNACTAMGVLVFLSSEMSVMNMVLLTVSRLYSVTKPFKSSTSPSTGTIVFLILLVWMLSLLLALLPTNITLQAYFVDVAKVNGNNPLFGSLVVDFPDAKDFVESLVNYSPVFATLTSRDIEELSRVASWKALVDFLDQHAPGEDFFGIEHYFGYYSANSVCIPNFFVTRSDRSWPFSLPISIFNFVAFLFVALTYVGIMIAARRGQNGQARAKSVARRNSKLQRKVLRLIATDFCCWIPLSIMVFLNFGGVQIDSISYAISAIVLLPINSAFNPILYSNFIDNLISRLIKSGSAWRTKQTDLGSNDKRNQIALQQTGKTGQKTTANGSGKTPGLDHQNPPYVGPKPMSDSA